MKDDGLSHTLIINYANMRFGGIEVYFHQLMLYAVDRGYRVLWVTREEFIKNASFQDIVHHPGIEKFIIGGGLNKFKFVDIELDEDENVTMISCMPADFVVGERLRSKKANIKSFDHILLLANFRDERLYLDVIFQNKLLKKFWFQFMKGMAVKWNTHNCVYGFSLKHLNYFEEYYQCKIEKKEKKVLPKFSTLPELSKEAIYEKARSRSKEFIITTCARFDFPHKGYILGLIERYGILKKRNPQLKLVIVGYGQGEAQIREKIGLLEEKAQKDIILTGQMQPEELVKQYQKSHLNIGLAGALTTGASCAIPSLSVRHHSYESETYGFIENIPVNTLLSDAEGEWIDPYIQQVIDMDDDAYYAHCVAAYNRVKTSKEVNPDYLFQQHNTDSWPTVRRMDRLLFILMYVSWSVLFKNGSA